MLYTYIPTSPLKRRKDKTFHKAIYPPYSFKEWQDLVYVQCPKDRASHIWSFISLLGAQGERVGLHGIKTHC